MNPFRTQLLDMVEYTDYIATFADPSRTVLDIDNYTYSIDGEVLAANITATVPQSFTTPMAGDCDFVMTYISGMARAQGATNLLINPALLVQITEENSGRTFFNGPAAMAHICGQGGFPFLLTSPRVLKARSSLKTTFISAQVQTFTGVYMCFHGSRIWYA